MENNKVLATVVSKQITEADIANIKRTFDPKTAAQYNTPDGDERILHELINQELFYLDATENNLDKEEEFTSQLEKFKADLLKQYYISKLLGNITVSDEEAQDFFENNKKMFFNPESIKASHILVETEKEALAVIDELNGGTAFEDAAKKYSSCPSKDNGGDLGYFTRGRMVPEFDKASFEMNKGEISGPVKTQFGYHIIKLIDRKEAVEAGFDQVKEQIKDHLLNSKQQKTYFGKSDELKGKYEVKINK